MTTEEYTFAGEGPLTVEEQKRLQRYDRAVGFALCRVCGQRFMFRCAEPPDTCGRADERHEKEGVAR